MHRLHIVPCTACCLSVLRRCVSNQAAPSLQSLKSCCECRGTTICSDPFALPSLLLLPCSAYTAGAPIITPPYDTVRILVVCCSQCSKLTSDSFWACLCLHHPTHTHPADCPLACATDCRCTVELIHFNPQHHCKNLHELMRGSLAH
jgi:hypothetical protein